MPLKTNESEPIPAEKTRPITRFFVLEAIIASGIIQPGLGILETYLKARTEFCFARAVIDPYERRMLLRAARRSDKIATGSLEAKKGFCRFMIGETSHRRGELLATAEASDHRLAQDYFTERARIAGRMSIGWINIRTHLESPPPPNMRISLLELLSTGSRSRYN